MTADVAGRPVVRADQVTLGVLVSEVPRDAVDDAVAVCGVREQRSDGKLPAYLTLGLVLFPDDRRTDALQHRVHALLRRVHRVSGPGWVLVAALAVGPPRYAARLKKLAESSADYRNCLWHRRRPFQPRGSHGLA